MKTTKFRYFYVTFILYTLVTTILQSQKLYTISVENNKFNPSALTINSGDTVKWINNSGSHNVNGTNTTFPSNPESFGNEVHQNWEYIFIFNFSGTYNYQCDPHASFGMVGTITVQGATVVYMNKENDLTIGIYQDQSGRFVTFEFPEPLFPEKTYNFFIYNLIGEKIEQYKISDNKSILFNTENLPDGIYIYRLDSKINTITAGKILIK